MKKNTKTFMIILRITICITALIMTISAVLEYKGSSLLSLLNLEDQNGAIADDNILNPVNNDDFIPNNDDDDSNDIIENNIEYLKTNIINETNNQISKFNVPKKSKIFKTFFLNDCIYLIVNTNYNCVTKSIGKDSISIIKLNQDGVILSSTTLINTAEDKMECTQATIYDQGFLLIGQGVKGSYIYTVSIDLNVVFKDFNENKNYNEIMLYNDEIYIISLYQYVLNIVHYDKLANKINSYSKGLFNSNEIKYIIPSIDNKLYILINGNNLCHYLVIDTTLQEIRYEVINYSLINLIPYYENTTLNFKMFFNISEQIQIVEMDEDFIISTFNPKPYLSYIPYKMFFVDNYLIAFKKIEENYECSIIFDNNINLETVLNDGVNPENIITDNKNKLYLKKENNICSIDYKNNKIEIIKNFVSDFNNISNIYINSATYISYLQINDLYSEIIIQKIKI